MTEVWAQAALWLGLALAAKIAVVPTLIANAFFLPRHLLPADTEPEPAGAAKAADL